MTTVTKPDKCWGTIFEQATKDISLFQKAVFEWRDTPEAISKDSVLTSILANRERGKLAMDMINRPDLPDAYHPEISRLTHVWTEVENKFFNRLQTDKDYTHRIVDEDFVKQINQVEGDLRSFFSQNLKADISVHKSRKSQNIDHCPDSGMLISFALNELENDQSAHIKEHVESCFLCQDLVFDTMMAENEAFRKQGEVLTISDNFLAAISPDPTSEFCKRLLHLVIVVNAHLKNRIRNQFFQQNGFDFATAFSGEEPFKGLDDIPFGLNITPRDGLLEIPCIGDAGEGKTFIEDILERSYFYTNVFAWDMAKNIIDLGINRHERNARAISDVGYSDILVVVGLDMAVVESAAQYVPLWFENEDFKIESTFNAAVVLLWYRVVKEDAVVNALQLKERGGGNV